MKKYLAILLICVPGFISELHARDSVGSYSIEEALSLEAAKAHLDDGVQFYFGSAQHGKIVKRFGEFASNKKTNAYNKTDKAACEWVFLSALISLKERALAEGGNAVINIQSNYKSHRVADEKTFQCGAGTFVAGVALVGDVVTIEK